MNIFIYIYIHFIIEISWEAIDFPFGVILSAQTAYYNVYKRILLRLRSTGLYGSASFASL